jgi:hypothetical protein
LSLADVSYQRSTSTSPTDEPSPPLHNQVALLNMTVTYMETLSQLINCYVTPCKVKPLEHRPFNNLKQKYEYHSTATFVSAALWLVAGVIRFSNEQYKVCDKLSEQYVHCSCLETVSNEANRSSTSPKILCILRNPKVHNLFHECPHLPYRKPE